MRKCCRTVPRRDKTGRYSSLADAKSSARCARLSGRWVSRSDPPLNLASPGNSVRHRRVSTSSLPSTLFKKNGSVHWRNCAEFYGVRRPTLRAWSKSGAPIFDPIAMDVWRRDRNSERLRKIGAANNRYRGKEEEILRLYQTKKMGLTF